MFGTRAVSDIQRLAFAAADHRRDRGRWPSLAELRTRDLSLPVTDPWRHDYRADRSDDQMVVRCAGIDGVFDTSDDILSDTVAGGGGPQ